MFFFFKDFSGLQYVGVQSSGRYGLLGYEARDFDLLGGGGG